MDLLIITGTGTGTGSSRELGTEKTPLMGNGARALRDELDREKRGLADADGLRGVLPRR